MGSRPTAQEARLSRKAHPDRPRRRCTSCGLLFPESRPGDKNDDFLVTYCENPYAAEIGDDHSESWQCGACLYESAMDI